MTPDEGRSLAVAVREAGLESAGLDDEDFQLLWAAKYRTADRLRGATWKGLNQAGLKAGVVDAIMAILASGAAADLGVGSAAGAAAAAGPGPGSAAAAGGTGAGGAGEAAGHWPTGPQTFSDLQSRLTRMLSRIDERVLRDLIRFYAPQLPYADDELLRQLYETVAAAPHSSTKALFQRQDGLAFNGPYSSGMPARAVLLFAFRRNGQPLLAKFTLCPTDVDDEHKVISKLLEASVSGIVSPVQLVRCSRGARSMGAKTAMLMPLYPATLQHVPCPVDAACLLSFGKQLRATLACIHKVGYGHNDVKAANVFLDNEGNCVLGDFGSARPLGAVPKESTNTHWPDNIDTTCAAADFFMLAVTLLERAGVHKLHEGPKAEDLRSKVQMLDNPSGLRDFVLGLLAT